MGKEFYRKIPNYSNLQQFPMVTGAPTFALVALT
jgi:hypothetical protein